MLSEPLRAAAAEYIVVVRLMVAMHCALQEGGEAGAAAAAVLFGRVALAAAVLVLNLASAQAQALGKGVKRQTQAALRNPPAALMQTAWEVRRQLCCSPDHARCNCVVICSAHAQRVTCQGYCWNVCNLTYACLRFQRCCAGAGGAVKALGTPYWIRHSLTVTSCCAGTGVGATRAGEAAAGQGQF